MFSKIKQIKTTMGCTATESISKTAALNTSSVTHSYNGSRVTATITLNLTLLIVAMTIVQCLTAAGTEAAALHSRLDEPNTMHINPLRLNADTETESVSDLSPLRPSHHISAGRYERTRLRKRHTDYVHFHALTDKHHMDWANPCNGTYEPTSQEQQLSSVEVRALRKHLRKQLRQTVGFEYLQLKDTLNVIDVQDMNTWAIHNKHYRFLPTIKRNSSVELAHWYRHMQVYVASFAYLGRAQYRWDHAKANYHSNLTVELNELFQSARRILCEIETTINGSFPNGGHRLSVIIGAEMEATLNFYTQLMHHNDEVKAADRTDLRFAKHHYIKFLRSMIRVLPHKANRKQRQRNSSRASSSMSLENASLPEDGSFDLSASQSVESSRSVQEDYRPKVHKTNNKSRRNKRKRLNRKRAELPQSK